MAPVFCSVGLVFCSVGPVFWNAVPVSCRVGFLYCNADTVPVYYNVGSVLQSSVLYGLSFVVLGLCFAV